MTSPARSIEEVLAAHFLASLGCDHVDGTDSPVCSCSLVRLGTFTSVGQAVDAWARHVAEQLRRAGQG